MVTGRGRLVSAQGFATDLRGHDTGFGTTKKEIKLA